MELRDKNGLTEAEFLAQYRPGDYPRRRWRRISPFFPRERKTLRCC